eukprot:scaffold83066_cov43-Attheya_sp.AAC.2
MQKYHLVITAYPTIETRNRAIRSRWHSRVQATNRAYSIVCTIRMDPPRTRAGTSACALTDSLLIVIPSIALVLAVYVVAREFPLDSSLMAPLLYSPKKIIVPPSSARDSLDTHKTLLAAMTKVQSERMT